MPTAQDVISLALSQSGVCESPMGSNRGTPYHAWFGAFSQGWQWCAIYVSWVIWKIDPDLFWRLKTAYSGGFLFEGAKHGREIDISQIAPGDICIWDRPVGGITDHIGFVVSVTPTTFSTVEGNSGDCVRLNENRPRVQTSACHYYFVRPNYSATPTPTKQEEDDMQYRQYENVTRAVYIDCYRDKADYWVTTDTEKRATREIKFVIEGKDGSFHPVATEGQKQEMGLQHDHSISDILKQPRFKGLKGSFKLTVKSADPIDISIREVPKG